MFSRGYLGEALSIASSLLWSISVILFRKSGFKVHPIALNLFKNVISLVLLSLTLVVLGDDLWLARPTSEYVILLVSGFIGIAISDTLFFMSLNILGASFSAIVDCVYSPFVVLFGFLMIDEKLSISHIAGGILIISAVLLTNEEVQRTKLSPRHAAKGILLGVLAMATTAFAIVMVKPILVETPLLWATNVRILGGVIGILVMGQFLPQLRKHLWDGFKERSMYKFSIPSSVLGGFVVLPLWVGGMKYTKVGIAAILNQMSTVFIVIWAALILKERITLRKALAVALAFSGASLILL